MRACAPSSHSRRSRWRGACSNRPRPALWVFDSDIEKKERVERGMSLRLIGLEDQRKLSRTSPAGPDTDEVTRKITSRIEDMTRAAGARGVEPHRNRRGQVDGFGAKMPGRLELVSRVPGGESDYRLLSAVAHGQSWSLIGVGFKPSGKQNMAVKSPEPIVLVYVCSRAIEFFARALWAQVYLYGWKSGPFARLLEETYDSIGLVPERRFWRSQSGSPHVAPKSVGRGVGAAAGARPA